MTLETPPPQRVRWPEFAHVIFDCDSTLSTIEGIDVLAESLGFAEEVAALTDAAMDGDIELNEVYAERLRMLRPSKQSVTALRSAYKRNVVTDAAAVVAGLLEVGIEVYVVSGGLADPVTDFAISLGIDPDNVRAVEAHHDSLSGEWWKAGLEPVDESYAGFEEGALTKSDGKAETIAKLLADKSGPSLLVGDGMSDLHGATSVQLFVGFGGVVHRKPVAAAAPIYITAPSLAPVLPIAVGPGGADRLQDPMSRAAFSAGLEMLQTPAVSFADESTRMTLLAALDRKQNHV